MRVLLVAHGFPRREHDTAAPFLLDLARGQQSLGHEVRVVAPHDAGLPREDTVGGVMVRRFRYGPDAAETLAYAGTMHEQVLRSWRARFRLAAYLAAMRRAVRGAVQRWHPHVVHVHWWFPNGLAVWPRRPRRTGLVLTSHGTDLFLLDRFPAARVVAGPIFRAADRVTVISSPLVARAVRLGVPEERITVVPMPAGLTAAPDAGRGSGEPGHLLFVGRLVERKGAEFALRALALLRARGRPARLTVVGEGPERERLEALAGSLGLADAVRFRGLVPRDAMGALYRSAAIFVLPAVTDWKGEQEGFGMVLVEAMRHRLPVVATRSGGIVDVVRDGETGLLVPERDAEALAAALERAIAEPGLAERLGDAGERLARDRFSDAAIARVFDGVYRDAARAAEAA